MNDDEYARGLAALIRLNDDALRERIAEVAPEIRLDIKVMTDLLRQTVNTERAKLGLDEYTGKLSLSTNKQKTESKQPDLVGTGRVAGHQYKVAAWIRKNGLEVVLSEPKKR